MDLGDLGRLIFWTWLAVSMVILFRRSMKKRAARRDEDGAGLSASDTAAAVAPGLNPPTSRDEGIATVAPAATEDADPAPDPPPPTARLHPSAPIAAHRGDVQPIASMVTGIGLPCDLTPVIDFVRRGGERESVAFVTRGYAAGTVGQAVGDELGRLGFEIESLTAVDVVATRDGARLNVAVLAEAATVERAGRPAFPGTGEGAVVVEFWT